MFVYYSLDQGLADFSVECKIVGILGLVGHLASLLNILLVVFHNLKDIKNIFSQTKPNQLWVGFGQWV